MQNAMAKASRNLLDTLSIVHPSEMGWVMYAPSVCHRLRKQDERPQLVMQCLITGRLFDLGYSKSQLYVGSVMLLLAVFGAAASTSYSGFMISQGILLGVSQFSQNRD